MIVETIRANKRMGGTLSLRVYQDGSWKVWHTYHNPFSGTEDFRETPFPSEEAARAYLARYSN